MPQRVADIDLLEASLLLPAGCPFLKGSKVQDRAEQEDSKAIKSFRNALCSQCLRLTQSDSEREKTSP